MVSCGCFSSAENSKKRPSPSDYVHQDSFPLPPTTFQEDDTKDIYSRITEVIDPIDAERNTATVNKRVKRSTDFDEEAGLTGSRHALLAKPSGGFTRTSSTGFRSSFDLRRTISDRGVQPAGRVTTPPLPDGDVWTESRKELELAIQTEKAKDHADWNPDLQSEEQRLRKRLSKLNLEMKVMIGDGNCQFRAVSFGLYGSQDYHHSIRQKSVAHMRAHKEEYAAFLGENIDDYLDSMEHSCTWGDELTLRAISDYWGIVINVVTSDQHNWFMRYKPPKIRILLEIFLTYIAPVHYNAIRRQTMTRALRSTLSRRTSSSIDQAMKRVYSAERALAATKLAPEVHEALRSGHKLDAPRTSTGSASSEGADAAAAAIMPAYKDTFQRRKTADKLSMDTVAEGLEEGRVSMTSGSVPSVGSPGPRDMPPSFPSGLSSEPVTSPTRLESRSTADDYLSPLEASPASSPASQIPVSAFAAEASKAGADFRLSPPAVANGRHPVQSF